MVEENRQTITSITRTGDTSNIQSEMKILTWDCKAQKWSQRNSTTYKNTLLASMHPDIPVALMQVPVGTTDTKLLKDFEGFKLDFASGSRTSGFFFATPAREGIGKLYFGDNNSARIVYGSILMSGCKSMSLRSLRLLIVDHENLETDTPGYNAYGCGDSHGKATFELLGQLNESIGEGEDENRPLQFRAGLKMSWVAKGTISGMYEEDMGGYDLILPTSSFKGDKKPSPGTVVEQNRAIYLGVLHEAQLRESAKAGWMFWQWFTIEAIEKDVLPAARKKAQQLGAAYDSIKELAAALSIEQWDKDDADVEGDISTSKDFISPFVRIIQADVKGLLYKHPYIVERVKDFLQERWVRLAKAGEVRFKSLMTMPDESLPEDHFCAADLLPGEYIVFCNPMRSWQDARLWQNVHQGRFTGTTGVMALTNDTALKLGRDFDGDFVQCILASRLPAIAAEIRNFRNTYGADPDVFKPGKVPIRGTLAEVALRSMVQHTGRVANLVGRARACGAIMFEDVQIKDFRTQPPSTVTKKVITALAQELQNSVDQQKSDFPVDTEALDRIEKMMNEFGCKELPWQKDLKNKDAFRNRPLDVGTGTDTVSHLMREVVAYWRQPDLDTSRPDTWRHFFPSDYSERQEIYAVKIRQNYREKIAEAIKYKEETGDSSNITAVIENHRNVKPKFLEFVDESGKKMSPSSWLHCFWAVDHMSKSGRVGLAFLLFTDEIIEELKNRTKKRRSLRVTHCHYYEPYRRKIWAGEQTTIKVYQRTSVEVGKGYTAEELSQYFRHKPDRVSGRLNTVAAVFIKDVARISLLPWAEKQAHSRAFWNFEEWSQKLDPDSFCWRVGQDKLFYQLPKLSAGIIATDGVLRLLGELGNENKGTPVGTKMVMELETSRQKGNYTSEVIAFEIEGATPRGV